MGRTRVNHYPDECWWDAPVPSPFPIPKCDCNITAVVQQSRHPLSAARAYFCCPKNVLDGCEFFPCIDDPEKYDERILLVPWTGKKAPYDKFKRWVPPPPPT
ncbi:hypothetical protein EJB05_24645 [Eragrostis curvula]|uniref:Uncharacterized protein n=1 Tax=Eragrostis curvula TaxID=38414 RepID=A0A5J9V9G4_9POAL|nr:hypothetical protein EJB05_24645 [Eragrostis curvula]